MNPQVREKLDRLPRAPGVYVMRGAAGRVLYVGKAADLRSRVRSYFTPGSTDSRFFVGRLEQELQDLETIVTANEREAFLLENSLIKELRPHYNVRLRDDKDYLSIRVDERADWPRLEPPLHLDQAPHRSANHPVGSRRVALVALLAFGHPTGPASLPTHHPPLPSSAAVIVAGSVAPPL
jgi:excinuclease UvrABC nuclease subunit